MNKVIEQLIETAPLYGKFLQQDIAISISDREQYLGLFETDTLKFPFPVGAKIKDSGYQDVLNRLARTRESVVNIVPKEITGTVTIKSIISPIVDGNEVVGYFSVSLNIEKESNVDKSSLGLMDSIETSKEAIHSIAKAAEDLNGSIDSIEHEMMCVEENIKTGNQSIQLIQGISKQSNLLGLNAAIEAARAGAAGKGFSIVASEMTKLAKQSKDIAEQVADSLSEIETSVEQAVKLIKETKTVSQEQYFATGEISNSVDVIAERTNELVRCSKE